MIVCWPFGPQHFNFYLFIYLLDHGHIIVFLPFCPQHQHNTIFFFIFFIFQIMVTASSAGPFPHNSLIFFISTFSIFQIMVTSSSAGPFANNTGARARWATNLRSRLHMRQCPGASSGTCLVHLCLIRATWLISPPCVSIFFFHQGAEPAGANWQLTPFGKHEKK